MASTRTWYPSVDCNGDGFRPQTFTATAVAIAKGKPVKWDDVNILACTAASGMMGITAEAIGVSGSGVVYTSGEFKGVGAVDESGGLIAGDHVTVSTDVSEVRKADQTGDVICGIMTRAGADNGDAYMKLVSLFDVPIPSTHA